MNSLWRYLKHAIFSNQSTNNNRKPARVKLTDLPVEIHTIIAGYVISDDGDTTDLRRSSACSPYWEEIAKYALKKEVEYLNALVPFLKMKEIKTIMQLRRDNPGRQSLWYMTEGWKTVGVRRVQAERRRLELKDEISRYWPRL